MGYVIVDGGGMYVTKRAFLFTDNERMYLSFTGRDSGFSYCLNEVQAKTEKDELQKISDECGFGKSFWVKYIDIKKISIGKLVIENLPLPKKFECKRCNNF